MQLAPVTRQTGSRSSPQTASSCFQRAEQCLAGHSPVVWTDCPSHPSPPLDPCGLHRGFFMRLWTVPAAALPGASVCNLQYEGNFCPTQVKLEGAIACRPARQAGADPGSGFEVIRDLFQVDDAALHVRRNLLKRFFTVCRPVELNVTPDGFQEFLFPFNALTQVAGLRVCRR